MACTRPHQVKKVIGTQIFVYQCSNDFLTWRGLVHAVYICVPMTFLTWHGRVHAIVYLCSNDVLNLAWTRTCLRIFVFRSLFLTWRGRVHAIYICVPITFLLDMNASMHAIVAMDASTPS